jgi:ankyrin repeat protein
MYPFFLGCTPLHYSAANGYVTIVRYLLENGKASISLKTKKGHTARHMAKTRAQTKMVAFLNEIG